MKISLRDGEPESFIWNHSIFEFDLIFEKLSFLVKKTTFKAKN